MEQKRKPKKPIKIGIIGTGFGVRTQLPVFQSWPEVKVVILCGRDLEKTKKIATANGIADYTNDYNEVCQHPKVDLVCIATPPRLHYEIAIAAVSAKKNVLCEKPLALHSSEAQEIIGLANKRPRHLYLIDHQLRFHKGLAMLKKQLHSGKIGRPYLVQMHQVSHDFFRGDSDWKWWFQGDIGGGLLFAMGTHLVDLLRHWFGRCRRVCANTEVLPDIRFDNGNGRRIEVETAFSASLKMESGVTALVSATAAGCSPEKTLSISIFGTGGELHFSNNTHVTLIQRDRPPKIFHNPDVHDKAKDASIFRTAFEDFANVLIPSLAYKYPAVPGAATFQDGLESLLILEAIRNSSETEESVEVPEVPPADAKSKSKIVQLTLPFFVEAPPTQLQKPTIANEFHIGHNRAMVSLGPYKEDLFCPYNCAFCYVSAGFSQYPNLQPDQIVAQLAWRRHYEPFDRVYISGDTDTFFPGRDGIGLMEALTSLNVDLLFTTRSVFTQEDLSRISAVVKTQRASGLLVFGCISICRLRSCLFLESKVPEPENRIQTLQALSEIDCVTILALRPFLPVIPAEEYCEIIERCASFIDGVLGEVWFVDKQGMLESKVLGPGKKLPDNECKEEKMNFDNNPFIWKVWEGDKIRKEVAILCEKLGLQFSMRSHPLVDLLKKKFKGPIAR